MAVLVQYIFAPLFSGNYYKHATVSDTNLIFKQVKTHQ